MADEADVTDVAVDNTKSKKKKILRVLIGVIVVIAMIVGVGYYLYTMRYVSTDDAQISVAEGSSVPISVSFPGRLNGWKIKVNDEVNQGQVLGSESNQSVLSLTPSLVPLVKADQLLAQKLIEMENIRSPISGKVVQANAAVGQGVQPGQALAVIANSDQLQVTANIKESDIRKVRVGQLVDLDIDGLPGQSLHGVVSRIDDVTQSVFSLVPNTTAASGSFTKVEQKIPVIIRITDKNLAKKTLVSGMSAIVKIYIK